MLALIQHSIRFQHMSIPRASHGIRERARNSRSFVKTPLRLLAVALLGFSLPSRAANPTPPNIVVILADDLGFSDLGCYGSEISTPNLDKLAENGLRFSQFYNTARCWPTRAAIITGYYPQQVNMDPLKGPKPEWVRTLPDLLKPAGYKSYHSGKWHLEKIMPRVVADGGFDRSYNVGDQKRFFSPTLTFKDDKKLPPVEKDSGYYATTAIADHAIECLQEHAAGSPDRPFFSYIAFTAPHFPLHAPAADIARYRDRYIEGWDAVRTRRWENIRKMGIIDCALPPLETGFVPRYFKTEWLEILGGGEIDAAKPWDSLTPAQQKFQASKMAVHAAMVECMDREIGRVLDQIRAMGAWDNTIVLFLSDNGASAEIMVRGDGHDQQAAPGSAESHLCLGPGWAAASNAPFRRYKIWTHEGGISTPLIVHWPAGLKANNEVRHEIAHVIDFAPTFLELAGITESPAPGAPPRPGVSLASAFQKPGTKVHDELYFHHEGNRGLRQGDYKLVSAREDKNDWELYNLAADRSELQNLAQKEPDRVKSMARRWKELDTRYTRSGDKK